MLVLLFYFFEPSKNLFETGKLFVWKLFQDLNKNLVYDFPGSCKLLIIQLFSHFFKNILQHFLQPFFTQLLFQFAQKTFVYFIFRFL